MNRFKSGLSVLLGFLLVLAVLPVHTFATPDVPTGHTGRAVRSAGVIARKKGAPANAAPRVLASRKGMTDQQYAEQLMATGEYERVVVNQVAVPLAYTAVPNDPHFRDTTTWGSIPSAKSWWVKGAASPRFDQVMPYLDETKSNAQPYYAQASGQQVPVAVIDSGYFMDHPDRGSNIVSGRDLHESYSGGVFTTDGDVTPAAASAAGSAGHGTMCASEIGQATDNTVGGSAASPGALVRMYKVFGPWVEGDATTPPGSVVGFESQFNLAVRRAADDGAKVISISLAFEGWSSEMQAAIDYAYGKGCVIVAAAGNDGGPTLVYPAALDHVIAVGATQTSDGANVTRWTGSNHGLGLDLMAPGVTIWGPTKPGFVANTASLPGYTFWSGTSMAAPLVAAAAADVVRLVPNLGPDQVGQVLMTTADDMDVPGYDTVTGYGQVDVTAAYEKLKADYPALAAPVVNGVIDNEIRETEPVLTWNAVPGATAYDISVNGRAPIRSTSTSYAVPPQADGPYTIKVQAVSDFNWDGAYSADTVTYTLAREPLPAPPVSPVPLVATAQRVSGANRFQTAVAAAREAYDQSPTAGTQWGDIRHIVVASGDDRAAVDPLAAAGLCGAYDAPLMLVSAASVDASVKSAVAEIVSQASGPVVMHVVGGAVAVPEARLLELKAAGGSRLSYTRVRAQGDRYDTAAAIADEVARIKGEPAKVLIANGADSARFFDALAVSPVSASRSYPVLLVSQDSVPQATQAFLARHPSAQVIVAGGPVAVSDRVKTSLSATRWAGANRYSTAATIANNALVLGMSTVRVAVAAKLPDALTGGSAVGRHDGVMVLAAPTSMPSETGSWLAAQKGRVAKANLYGGEKSASDAVLSAIVAGLN